MPINETPTMPTEEQFAAFGKYVSASLGAALEWPGADMLEDFGNAAVALLGVHVGDQSTKLLTFWRTLADEIGVAHDGNDDQPPAPWEPIS